MKSQLFATILISSLLLFGANSSNAQPTKPKLVVVVSYDQLRGDLLEKYKSEFGKDGFARFFTQGTVCKKCLLNHGNCMTAPGHAVLLTGCYAHKHGIVTNEMYDRKKKREFYCCEIDSSTRGYTLMQMPTLGELLQKKDSNAKNSAIAIKDRAAILMAGKTTNSVLWLDPSKGGYASSKMYKLPTWLKAWNTKNHAKNYQFKTWERILFTPFDRMEEMKESIKLPAELKEHKDLIEALRGFRATNPQYHHVGDNMPWEGSFPAGDRYFPHEIPSFENKLFWDAFVTSPYSIEHLFNLGKELIDNEKFGADSVTDVLSIGVSTTDVVGHTFGPDSREMKEILLQSDKILAQFLRYLDEKIGSQNYTMVITADHGVTPVPEFSKSRGINAGRISGDTLEHWVNTSLTDNSASSLIVEEAVSINLQTGKAEADPLKLVEFFEPPSVFINQSILQKYGLDPTSTYHKICSKLLKKEGIGIALPASMLQGNTLPEGVDSSTFAILKNDYYPSRCGDIIVYPKENWVWGSKPATHGSPYFNDRHVTLMFLGANVDAQSIEQQCSPADIAPTLGTMLGISIPNTDGVVLQLRNKENK